MFLLLCVRLGFNWAISSTLLKVSYMYMDEYNEKFGKSFKQLTKKTQGHFGLYTWDRGVRVRASRVDTPLKCSGERSVNYN
jgi:hypothetical protein